MVSPDIPELSYSEFSRRLHSKRIPLYGTLETTFRCNLNCVHCYVNEPMDSKEIQSHEMPLERLRRLIDEIVELGCLELLLTGGEVLARSDFPELFSYAVRKGLRVTVFTNGTMVTERVISLFKQYPPKRVEITLYGMTRATYERVTRIPGSFDKCIRGVRLLLENGIHFALKTMVLQWNEHEVSQMRSFAEQVGVTFRHDALVNPRVDGKEIARADLQVSSERLVAIDLQVPKILERQHESAKGLSEARGVEGGGKVYSCGAGRVAFTVDPYGNLQLCQLSRKFSFNLTDAPFADGWNGHFPKLLARTKTRDTLCVTCHMRSLCAGCPGANELESGDAEKPVAQFCEITHQRMHALKSLPPGHLPDGTCCLNQPATSNSVA